MGGFKEKNGQSQGVAGGRERRAASYTVRIGTLCFSAHFAQSSCSGVRVISLFFQEPTFILIVP